MPGDNDADGNYPERGSSPDDGVPVRLQLSCGVKLDALYLPRSADAAGSNVNTDGGNVNTDGGNVNTDGGNALDKFITPMFRKRLADLVLVGRACEEQELCTRLDALVAELADVVPRHVVKESNDRKGRLSAIYDRYFGVVRYDGHDETLALKAVLSSARDLMRDARIGSSLTEDNWRRLKSSIVSILEVVSKNVLDGGPNV